MAKDIERRLQAIESRLQVGDHRKEFAQRLQLPEVRAQAMKELLGWRRAMFAEMGRAGMSDAEVMQGIVWKE